MEAPHLQFMGSEKAYERFHSRSIGQILTKITVYGVDREHENLYKIRCEIHLSRFGEEKGAHIVDRWVKVQDEWYHVEKNPLIFPFTM
jgi:hypothetical protein